MDLWREKLQNGFYLFPIINIHPFINIEHIHFVFKCNTPWQKMYGEENSENQFGHDPSHPLSVPSPDCSNTVVKTMVVQKKKNEKHMTVH